MFSLWFLLGICFGEGFHLCGRDTEPGLIRAFYLNSMGTRLSMKHTILCQALENISVTVVV